MEISQTLTPLIVQSIICGNQTRHPLMELGDEIETNISRLLSRFEPALAKRLQTQYGLTDVGGFGPG